MYICLHCLLHRQQVSVESVDRNSSKILTTNLNQELMSVALHLTYTYTHIYIYIYACTHSNILPTIYVTTSCWFFFVLAHLSIPNAGTNL